MPDTFDAPTTIPTDVRFALQRHGITATTESEMRIALEARVATYTLYRLSPAAARKWKAHYRIMFGATYFDCQTVLEAYARALLFTLDGASGTVGSPSITPGTQSET